MNTTKQAPQGDGPLAGIRVIEIAGMGPGPFACMLLSDMGAEVIRIDRPDMPLPDPRDIVARGRRTLNLDLKQPEALKQILALLEKADILVEGFRPGVMERLGLGPDVVCARNQRLVYGRMTGWGQSGPLAQTAGHDINYIALAGALAAVGEKGGPPVPPLNLVGDYGGGSLYLVIGLLAALHASRSSGLGQVVDAAICDGVLSLMSNNLSHIHRGMYQLQRGSNMLDGGAPYYGIYPAKDGLPVSVGAIEPKFFQLLCEKLGLGDEWMSMQNDKMHWPALHAAIAAALLTRTRDEWSEIFLDTDACFFPVLGVKEAAQHPHILAREGFIDINGVQHTAPAPRFSRTPSQIQTGNQNLTISFEELKKNWTL